MQSTNLKHPQQSIETRIRTLRILWMGMFMSIVLYFLLTLFVERDDKEPDNTLSLMLLGIAASNALISFPIKSWLLTRATERGQVQLVQQAYIVALALAEVAALLGLLDYFASGDRYYYILFLIGACAQLLHFPRREHVLNAWPKSPIS